MNISLDDVFFPVYSDSSVFPLVLKILPVSVESTVCWPYVVSASIGGATWGIYSLKIVLRWKSKCSIVGAEGSIQLAVY